jgi:hypothetical protein
VWRARRKPHGGGYEEEEGGGVGDPQKSRSASFLLLVTAWPREGSGGGEDRETRGGVVCGLRCATCRFARAFRCGLVGFSSSVSPLHRSCPRWVRASWGMGLARIWKSLKVRF